MVNIRLRHKSRARARAPRRPARRGESADKSRAQLPCPELAVAQSSPDMVIPSPISGFHLLLSFIRYSSRFPSRAR